MARAKLHTTITLPEGPTSSNTKKIARVFPQRKDLPLGGLDVWMNNDYWDDWPQKFTRSYTRASFSHSTSIVQIDHRLSVFPDGYPMCYMRISWVASLCD